MKILVGLDSSAAGNSALTRAVEEAERSGAQLHLVAHAPRPGTAEGLSSFDAERTEMQRHLDATVEELRGRGVDCTGHLPVSQLDPSQAILHVARVEKVDLIVIGLRARSKVGKLLLGSNAQDILLGAECDVLAVRVG